LKTHPKLMQQLLVMRAADQFAKCRLDFDQVHKILDLTGGLTGSWVPISKDYVVFRDRDHLVLRRGEEVQDFRFAVLPNHQYSFDRFAFSSELVAAEGIKPNGNDAEYVDADAIGPPELVLRSWQEGDAFIPLGMKSAKKISDFFVDAKVPIYEKRWVPILTTKSGEIVWVCGHRIDDRFKLTEKSKRALRLQYSIQQKSDVHH
jgi:tRNA(Ile)-lysidine synthase